MAKKKTSTAEDKLRALFDLQIIDSRIDRLRVVRGELPLEVQDLEDELEGLRARLERMEDDNDQVNQRIQSSAMASIGSSNSLNTPLERYALRNPIVCSPDLPVRKAVARMHDNDVGSMIITDDNRRPTGIFTLLRSNRRATAT